MLYSNDSSSFNKGNLDKYLYELAKVYRKLDRKTVPAEIILVGGAAILANYGFRDMTYDVDAIIISSSAMKEAINYVGDKFNLPNGWLNTDFMKTKSYTSKLVEYSAHYRTFANVLSVRVITGEYLIAMKLMSGRKYKNDMSDIIGILKFHKDNGTPIELGQLDVAVNNLYGNWDQIPENSKKFIEEILSRDNWDEVYERINNQEASNKIVLQDFEEKYPNVLSEDNLDLILEKINEKGAPA